MHDYISAAIFCDPVDRPHIAVSPFIGCSVERAVAPFYDATERKISIVSIHAKTVQQLEARTVFL